MIGLVFSLHTHVDMVWKSHTPTQNKNQLTYYQRLMPTHIISQLIHHVPPIHPQEDTEASIVHPYGRDSKSMASMISPAARSNSSPPSQIHALHGTAQEGGHVSYASLASGSSSIPVLNATGTASSGSLVPPAAGAATLTTTYLQPAKEPNEDEEEEEEEEAAGHDSPNWSKTKSFIILFGCTLLYSIIAEILVDTVDEVMQDFPMDEKFLGLTLFALVPNITEFMNAISFALYGNIVLSMEIGSAYALQVCLLQIPAMVAFSVWYNYGKEEIAKFTFR